VNYRECDEGPAPGQAFFWTSYVSRKDGSIWAIDTNGITVLAERCIKPAPKVVETTAEPLEAA
jgi:hypothetical protein